MTRANHPPARRARAPWSRARSALKKLMRQGVGNRREVDEQNARFPRERRERKMNEKTTRMGAKKKLPLETEDNGRSPRPSFKHAREDSGPRRRGIPHGGRGGARTPPPNPLAATKRSRSTLLFAAGPGKPRDGVGLGVALPICHEGRAPLLARARARLGQRRQPPLHANRIASPPRYTRARRSPICLSCHTHAYYLAPKIHVMARPAKRGHP